MAAERHTLTIAAPAQTVFDTLVDYESMPDWQSTVRSVEVEESDERGRGVVVRWEIDAKLRSVAYRLRYVYDEPTRIGSEYIDGDVRSVDGEYLLDERGDGTTEVTFALAIDPGMFVPGRVRRMLSDQVMRRSLEDLKARVEGGRE